MSKKYTEAMDKIVASDELKAKILRTAAQKRQKENSKPRYSFYIRTFASAAACLAILITSVSVHDDFVKPELPLVKPNPPAVTAPEISEKPNVNTSKNAPIQKSESPVLPNKPTVTNEPEISNNNDYDVNTEAPENHEKNEVIPPLESKPNEIPIDLPTSSNPNAGGENDENDMSVSAPNFGSESLSYSEITEKVGYAFKLPQFMPSEYKMTDMKLMFDELIQIEYLSSKDTVIFRTEKTDGDISGDYNVYENVQTVKISGTDVTLKGDGEKISVAVWNNENAYSISSSYGTDKETIIKIIENIGFPSEEE